MRTNTQVVTFQMFGTRGAFLKGLFTDNYTDNISTNVRCLLTGRCVWDGMQETPLNCPKYQLLHHLLLKCYIRKEEDTGWPEWLCIHHHHHHMLRSLRFALSFVPAGIGTWWCLCVVNENFNQSINQYTLHALYSCQAVWFMYRSAGVFISPL